MSNSFHESHRWGKKMKASCDECGRTFYLTTIDADGVLIGDECACGYYVTRTSSTASPHPDTRASYDAQSRREA